MTDFESRAKALDEIIDSIRDLYTCKIKLPLGNPNLKLVHTNQFLFTELPEDVFELANMPEISSALGSKYSRYSGYKLNRWYIESITITNDGDKATMELEVNPFATSLIKYQDDKKGFVKAYSDAKEQQQKQEQKQQKQNNKTKSTSTNIKLKNVKGFNKNDQDYIKKIVKEALKKKGNPKKEKQILFAIYEHYHNNHVYSSYNDMPKMCSGGFKSCWKKQNHNCGDGAATLTAMFRCAGLKADIYLGHHHYWVRVKADGDYYYCDQSGAIGKRSNRKPGKKGNDSNVWHGISGGTMHNSYC